MKKKFRIIAAALALCLSVLCSPAALAGGYGTAAATQPAAAVQTISTSQKTEQQVWIPTHGGKKYHSKSSCSGMKGPEKVSLSTAKQKVLPLKGKPLPSGRDFRAYYRAL